jgi:hypothetical protein
MANGQHNWLAGIGVLIATLLAPTASNATKVFTSYDGVITSGIDVSGVFGVPGADLTGDAISIKYLTDDATPGSSSTLIPTFGSEVHGYGPGNPVTAAVFVGGHSLSIGQGVLGQGFGQTAVAASGFSFHPPFVQNLAQQTDSVFVDTSISAHQGAPFPWDYRTPFTYVLQSGDSSNGQLSYILGPADAVATFRPVSVTVSNNAPPPIAAIATLSSSTVDFGTVRGGTPNVTGKTTVTNTATGFPVDNLNVASATGLPADISVNGLLPVGLGSLQSGDISFLINTSKPGPVGGAATLGFTSTSVGETLDLPTQQVSFSGTVTQLANAALVLDSGSGNLTGNGTSYSLSLGPIMASTGLVTSDIGVLNDILDTAFAETLGGSFSGGAGKGYSFSGASFSGLAGGSTDIGNLLTFDTTGLKNGVYTDTITFDGLSSYSGLGDQSLSPIVLTISATIFGSTAVPEPGTWTLMLLGLGGLGAMVRSRRATVSRYSPTR